MTTLSSYQDLPSLSVGYLLGLLFKIPRNSAKITIDKIKIFSVAISSDLKIMNQIKPSSSPRTDLHQEITKLPSWLKAPIGNASDISTVQKIIRKRAIHTICEEGRCPNR